MDEITLKLRHEFIKRVMFFADFYDVFGEVPDTLFFQQLADRILEFYSSSYKVRENIKNKILQRLETENAEKEEATRETDTEIQEQGEGFAAI